MLADAQQKLSEGVPLRVVMTIMDFVVKVLGVMVPLGDVDAALEDDSRLVEALKAGLARRGKLVHVELRAPFMLTFGSVKKATSALPRTSPCKPTRKRKRGLNA